jgi:hypothetical protein
MHREVMWKRGSFIVAGLAVVAYMALPMINASAATVVRSEGVPARGLARRVPGPDDVAPGGVPGAAFAGDFDSVAPGAPPALAAATADRAAAAQLPAAGHVRNGGASAAPDVAALAPAFDPSPLTGLAPSAASTPPGGELGELLTGVGGDAGQAGLWIAGGAAVGYAIYEIADDDDDDHISPIRP